MTYTHERTLTGRYIHRVPHSEHRFPATRKDVVNQCLEFDRVQQHKHNVQMHSVTYYMVDCALKINYLSERERKRLYCPNLPGITHQIVPSEFIQLHPANTVCTECMPPEPGFEPATSRPEPSLVTTRPSRLRVATSRMHLQTGELTVITVSGTPPTTRYV